MAKTCPHCNAQTEDLEWCDVCGGDLRPQTQGWVPWLEVNGAVAFSWNGRQRFARVVDVLESYASRRVLHARLCPLEEEGDYFRPEERGGHAAAPAEDARDVTQEAPMSEPDWPLLWLEESEEDSSLEPTLLTPEVRDLVRLPIARLQRSTARRLDIFEAPPGKPLLEILEQQGRLLALEEAALVTQLLLDALERVHKAGLYHFQICPWTLRLEPADPLDVAPPTLSRPKESLRLSFDGLRGFYNANTSMESHPVIVGFSPPEFFRRTPGPLDQRADIFGVGMLFYYLMSGSPPPTGAMTRHRPCLPLRAYRFELPPGLQPFIDGCTAFQPAERFADMAQARASLLAALDVVQRRQLHTTADVRPVSLFCAVDSHIGIGKGRRTPINQDAVFLGYEPSREFALVAVGDGVSTASFGSGDVASRLMIEAAAEVWQEVLRDETLISAMEPVSLDLASLAPGESAGSEDDDRDHTVDSGDQSGPSSSDVGRPREGSVTRPEIPAAMIARLLERPSEALSTSGAPSEDPSGSEPASEAPPEEPTSTTQAEALAPEEPLSEAERSLLEGLEQPPLPDDEDDQDDDQDDDDQDDDAEDPDPDAPFEGEDRDDEDDDDTGASVGRVGLMGQRTEPLRLNTPVAYLLRRALEKSNEAVSAYINGRYAPFSGPVHEVMGTTAVLAFIHKDILTLASLGDSRAYLLRDGHMECLTRDHNLATMRILEGFAADESLSLPQGAALARCLGTFEVQRGLLHAVAPEPDLLHFRLLPGDTILLTTDGLLDFAGPTEAIAERNIKEVLMREEIPAMACLRLILLANEGGGEDNIGVSVLRVTDKQVGHRPSVHQAFPPVRTMCAE
jgi:protein phosphatase